MVRKSLIGTGIISFITLVSIAILICVKNKNSTDIHDIVLSKEITNKVDRSILGVPKIIGIVVVSMDLPSNSRRVIYRYETSPALKKKFDSYFQEFAVAEDEPLFVKNDDDLNARIIRLINHQFDCVSYGATIASKLVPESIPLISTACSVSIPPSFGGFRGMITVFLSSPPTENEKSIIQLSIKEMSELLTPLFVKN